MVTFPPAGVFMCQIWLDLAQGFQRYKHKPSDGRTHGRTDRGLHLIPLRAYQPDGG
jgi:hypothetical protein